MIDEFASFFDWSRDADGFCAKIAQRRSTLKIVMKTKNELELLRPWIEWHSEICGMSNIFVLDNMSTSPEVADVYRSHPEITICRYSNFIDNVHNRSIFGKLYSSLSAGAEYYVFLDTDEFLTLVKDADCHDRRGVVEFIESNPGTALFPGIWMQNHPGSRTKFDLGGNCGYLRGGLLWGKPITNAGTNLFSDVILHNSGAVALSADDIVLNNLAVLHLQRLFPERRIRSGVNKLIHHRALPAGATLSDALAIPEDNLLHKHARNILSEIRFLVANPDAWKHADEDLPIGVAEFRDDGRVIHSTSDQRNHFQRVLEDRSLFFRTMESERAGNK